MTFFYDLPTWLLVSGSRLLGCGLWIVDCGSWTVNRQPCFDTSHQEERKSRPLTPQHKATSPCLFTRQLHTLLARQQDGGRENCASPAISALSECVVSKSAVRLTSSSAQNKMRGLYILPVVPLWQFQLDQFCIIGIIPWPSILSSRA